MRTINMVDVVVLAMVEAMDAELARATDAGEAPGQIGLTVGSRPVFAIDALKGDEPEPIEQRAARARQLVLQVMGDHAVSTTQTLMRRARQERPKRPSKADKGKQARAPQAPE